MAQLTDYLSSPSGGKPVITDKVQSPDYFGAATDLFKVVAGAQPTAAEKAARVKAEQAQMEIDAKNFFSENAEDIIGRMGQGDGIPEELKTKAHGISKMRRAGISSVRVDAELQGLLKTVAAKYPDVDHSVFYSWLRSNGLDDFVFRQQKNQLDMEQAQIDAKVTALKDATKRLADKGYIVANLSASEIIATDSVIQERQYKFEQSEAQKEADRKDAAEKREQGNYEYTAQTRKTAAEQAAEVENRLSLAQTDVRPRVQSLAQLASEAVGNPEREELFRQTVREYQLSLASSRLAAKQGIEAYDKDELSKIDGYFDSLDKIVNSLANGDMSSNQRLLDLLSASETRNKTMAWETIPETMAYIQIFGQAGAEKLVGITKDLLTNSDNATDQIDRLKLFGEKARGTSTNSPSLSPQVSNDLSKRGAGFATPNLDAATNAIASPTPDEVAELKEKNPPAYNTAINLSTTTAPGVRLAFNQDPSPENQQIFANTHKGLLFEAARLNTKTSEQHVDTILKVLPPSSLIQSLKTFKANGDPQVADWLIGTANNAYFRAFQRSLKDLNSTALGSTFSASKVGSAVIDNNTVATPVRFNEKTGRFEGGFSRVESMAKNGRNRGQGSLVPIPGKENPTAVKLNTLLDAIVETEMMRNPSSPVSGLAMRRLIVDGSDTELLMQDIEAGITQQTQGWSQTVSPVLVMQNAADEAAEAAKQTTAPKKTSSFTDKWASMISPQMTEIAAATGDEEFMRKIKEIDDYAKARLEKPLDYTIGLKNRKAAGAVGGSAILQEQMKTDPQIADVVSKIDQTEGGGDYNKLYANSETSEFSNIKVTSMTVDELIEFTKPSGEYGQFVKGSRPDKEAGVSTPLGRYQIVGSTLKSLKTELGLTGDELFNEDLQDAMFLALYYGRLSRGEPLSSEWQGLKKFPEYNGGAE